MCLLISFLALISMNMRILSGFLFLIASIITLPLVLLFVTLIIPIFFFIIAIMMFARKSKVETVPMYGPSHGYENQYYPRDEYDDRYYGSNRNINDDYDYDDHNQYNDYDEDYVESPPKTKNLNVVHVVKNLITMMISIVIIEITTTMKQRFVKMKSKI